jgi:purine-binding chemotaxis protein CheW
MVSDSETTGTAHFLTFTLDQEMFALDIAQVREILEFNDMTSIPRMPRFMRGVINLRGRVVSVIDLRLKLGISATEKTTDTCVIIVEAAVDGDSTVLGVLADSVHEVINLEPEQIDPPPRLGSRLKTEFIRGMARRGEQFIILLHLGRIFTVDEVRAASI